MTLANSRLPLLAIIALLSVMLLNACAGRQAAPGPIKNPHDPLIERIFSASGPSEIDPAELHRRMADSEVIYLGENHDNTHHHANQLASIKALVELGKKPAIGFEFFAREQTSRLLQYQQSADRFHGKEANHSAEKLLRSQLGWGDSRDDDWAHLFPILQFAREQQLPVFGADLNAGLRKQLSKHGYDGLSPVEKQLVPASNFKDDAYREFMFQSFTVAHCGWRNDGYLQRLYETWLLRNQAMAQSIVAMHEATPDQPVVIIMGGAHSQYNMAVYERVAQLHPGMNQLNLRMQAVAAAPLPPEEYFKPLRVNDQSYGPPYEYIWFTARMPEREDPCKAFLKYKQQHGQHGKNGKAKNQPTEEKSN